MPQAYGIGGLINVPPAAIKGSSAPAASFKGQLGQIYIDSSAADASAVYVYDGNSWVQNQLSLDTDGTFASASNSTASSSLAIKTYVDATASFGAPIASDVAQGIAWTATDAQCVAGTANDATNAYMVSPDNLVAIFASPNGPIGGTAAVAGTFTDLTADGTGAVSLTGNAASTLTNTAGDLTVDAQAGSLILDSGEAAADAVKINASNAAGGIDVDAGTGGITIDSGDAISLDGAAASNFTTSAGDISIIASAASVNITGAENAADAIVLNASAGGIDITAAGAAGEDIDIVNTAGSIHLNAGEAATDAINIDSSGGVDVDAAGQVNIASSQNAQDSIVITSSAGGIDILANGAAAGEDIDIQASSSINLASTENAALAVYLSANGGPSETIRLRSFQGTGADSIDLLSSAGGITLRGALASADAINISATNAAGGIDIDSGTGGVIVDSTGAISLDGAAASNFSVSGAGVDLDLASAAGRVIVTAGEDAADAIYLHANAGTSEKIRIHSDQGTSADSVALASDVGGITLTSGLASADAINIVASDAAGGVDIDAGTAGVIVDSTGAVSLDAAAASNFSTSGAGVDLTLESAAGRVIINGGEDAADVIYLHANAGTSEKIRLHADQGTSADSVHLESDVGGITLTSGLASADAINLSASAGGVDVDGALQVNIASSQAATGALTLAASNAAGNITMTGAVACTPDSITSDNAGVAASINTGVTLITTDGDSNLDNVTLADGLIAGQIKHFAVIAAGNAADSVKITPANMAGGTQITFAADPTGLGCSMVFDGTNWTVFANNGGVIA